MTKILFVTKPQTNFCQ